MSFLFMLFIVTVVCVIAAGFDGEIVKFFASSWMLIFAFLTIAFFMTICAFGGIFLTLTTFFSALL